MAHDSGIVPDGGEPMEKTAGHKSSWRLNQGLDMSDVSIDQPKTAKSGVQTKKISFKDEIDFGNRPFSQMATKYSKKQQENIENDDYWAQCDDLGQVEDQRGISEGNVLLGMWLPIYIVVSD